MGLCFLGIFRPICGFSMVYGQSKSKNATPKMEARRCGQQACFEARCPGNGRVGTKSVGDAGSRMGRLGSPGQVHAAGCPASDAAGGFGSKGSDIRRSPMGERENKYRTTFRFLQENVVF